MQFSCANCQKQLAIPDEKLPNADKFIIPCPFCKTRNTVDKNGPGGKPVTSIAEPAPQAATPQPQQQPAPPAPPQQQAAAPQSGAPQAPPPPPPKPAPPSTDGVQLEPEIFPPGSYVAFVMCKDTAWKKAIEDFMQSKGYHVSTAPDVATAGAKLRLNTYQAVIIEDDPEYAPLEGEVLTWSGIRRREVNLALVGDAAPSQDVAIAFTRSANMYLNRADAPKAPDLLESFIKGFDAHYELLNVAKEKMLSADEE